MITTTFTTMTDEPPTLKEAQKIVGGYVEIVASWGQSQMLADEDGRSKGLPINEKATGLVGKQILGHVLLLIGTARLT